MTQEGRHIDGQKHKEYKEIVPGNFSIKNHEIVDRDHIDEHEQYRTISVAGAGQ